MTLRPSFYCSTCQTHVATFGGTSCCIHMLLLRAFRCCNSRMKQFLDIDAWRSLVTDHIFRPVKVSSSKKFGLRTYVLAMSYRTFILTSCNITGAAACGFLPAQCTKFLKFTLPVKKKCVSAVHNIRKGQLLSSS
ncbi:hypothetical protein AVEN_87835-1 [Araneus ventricosus]|uniref:Uncharacterized protein n=1 Tax=Araneus ventricosus TaxID=182803 RepID=A0A4Y2BDP3_ARAVE|nr:hypothetical protein AVEN_87835-1 [Araneus ventricosus]